MKEITNKEFILNNFIAENKDFPGLDGTKILLQFDNYEKGDFNINTFITADYRDGQYLAIKNINKDILTCEIVTTDSEEWFDKQYLNKNQSYYKVVFPTEHNG